MAGKVELQSVRFAYPERPKIMVFQDFDLVVDAGKTVALCGQSGSGKSSIVALILRFYDPAAGAVSRLNIRTSSGTYIPDFPCRHEIHEGARRNTWT